ncbi:cysteine protease ATG4C isoform X2 [Drosophila grimshawi]|uniref:Cysteine protease n=2 Tax=Drosophila grimshawi TaxID=7222 RepID=B4JU42_DROGR|nr:cysteine protease ATG4C isoform X2 [Drosophila grimshawi]EDV91012.1 GH16873 [Drosophila grimshawi]
MNYDGLLSQLTDDNLVLFDATGQGAAGAAASLVNGDVQDGAIEEEQAAPIQTIPHTVAAASANLNTKVENCAATATPQRKISTSSRFMNAFSQLYGGNSNHNSNNSCAHVEHQQQHQQQHQHQNQHHHQHNEDADLAANRTPTKGMESKLVAMWHNVKYGWGGKIRQTSFSKEQPVWLLGRCYHRRYTPPVSMENSITELPSGAEFTLDNATSAYDSIPATAATTSTSSSIYPAINPQQIDEIVVPQELGMDAAENQVTECPWEEGIEGFRRDFYSRIWMTYRREFPIMNGSNYTSDCGWGCMLRSGQMLIAQGLICHFLGRSWRYDPESQLHSTYEDNMHKKIIKWFGDSSSKNSPFSIHALVRLGEQLGKKPGDWYGPASVSYLLKHALEHAAQENADFDNISVYVAQDCTIYMQDVEQQCSIPEPAPKQHVPWQHAKKSTSDAPKLDQPPQQHWKSLIVLIPLRLGTDKLNPVYAHCLKLLLSTEHCLGIIGGKPKHSLYFVGFQEDKLIHLDPHYCQEMVDVNQETFSMHSFHCKSPRKIKSSKMDPSCCIGFYCATKTDFDSFVESVQLYLHPKRCASGATMDKSTSSSSSSHPQQQTDYMEMNYPLFTFSRGRCLDHARDEMSDSLYKPLIKQVATLTEELEAAALPQLHSHEPDPDDSESEEFVLL